MTTEQRVVSDVDTSKQVALVRIEEVVKHFPIGAGLLGGQVVNPYTRGDPSGSSSGSGAGGTLAYAAATFGTETSGSVLSPSAANSMVGLKPTVGAIRKSVAATPAA